MGKERTTVSEWNEQVLKFCNKGEKLLKDLKENSEMRNIHNCNLVLTYLMEGIEITFNEMPSYVILPDEHHDQ